MSLLLSWRRARAAIQGPNFLQYRIRRNSRSQPLSRCSLRSFRSIRSNAYDFAFIIKRVFFSLHPSCAAFSGHLARFYVELPDVDGGGRAPSVSGNVKV
jgi:hypothetical protein